MRNILLITAGILLFASCKKDDTNDVNPPVSEVPYIELKSVSPTTVVEYQDSIIFDIFYKDGDGDLGYDDPDSLSLYLTDTRIPVTESYFIPLLAPVGADIAIQGDLLVKLDRTILLDESSSSENVTFTIQLRDRAGNYSNIVTCPQVTVLPQ